MPPPAILAANVQGGRPPIVFVHCWSRNEGGYFDQLAASVDPDQPMYAIPAPVDPDEQLALQTVDAWVERERRWLTASGVAPPYRLMGWSFAGVVAFELARRLLLEGIEVESVGMVDTWRPQRVPRSRWARHLAALRERSSAERLVYLGLLVRFAYRQGRASVTRWSRAATGRAEPVPAARKPISPALRSIRVPFVKYEASPAPAGLAITLYSCRESIERNGGDRSLGWAPVLLHGFGMVDLPGTHHSLWSSENIGVLAAELR